MKKIQFPYSFWILTLLAIFFIDKIAGGQELTGTSVTYIGNEGFMISNGGSKVIVDALFGDIKGDWCEQPSDSMINLMVDGQPPFDGIKLVLVSHYHSDHFSEEIANRYLLKNANTVMVCPEQVSDKLVGYPEFPAYAGRIISIPPDKNDTTIRSGDVEVTAFTLNHGSYYEKDTVTGELTDLHRNVQNIAYLVKTSGKTFFHSGDASIKSFGRFNTGGIDSDTVLIAFMDRIFMKPDGMKVIGEIIKPENLIFMHIEPSRVEYYQGILKDIPGMFIFSKPMEVRVF